MNNSVTHEAEIYLKKRLLMWSSFSVVLIFFVGIALKEFEAHLTIVLLAGLWPICFSIAKSFHYLSLIYNLFYKSFETSNSSIFEETIDVLLDLKGQERNSDVKFIISKKVSFLCEKRKLCEQTYRP